MRRANLVAKKGIRSPMANRDVDSVQELPRPALQTARILAAIRQGAP